METHVVIQFVTPACVSTFVVSDENFATCTPATGDLDNPIDDLVKLNDVNQVLSTLRQRHGCDPPACIISIDFGGCNAMQ